MELKHLLSLDCTKSAVQCTSKKRALEMIADLAAKKLTLRSQSIFESFLNREKLGSTGIGNGVAIPHGRIQTTKPLGILLRCKEAIKFDSIDNQPVDLLFALLLPDEQCKTHLDALASIAKKLGDKQLCRQLRQADSDLAVFDIITG